MRIGRFVMSLLFVLVAAGPSWTQEPAQPGTEASATRNSGNATEPLTTVVETKNRDLTMAEVLSLTLTRNPTLAAFDANIRAKDAAALQSGLLPNPELAIEMENFSGKDELAGYDGAETSIYLSQLLELGGKRGKRKQIAKLEKDLADWDYQSQKLDLLAITAKDFIQLLAAQQLLLQSEELVGLSEQTLAAVTARVEAGKVPPLEKIRAQVELASARTNASRASRELKTARRRLATRWNAPQADFAQAVGNLSALESLPAEEILLEQLQNNPDLARWQNQLEQQQTSYSLAKSQAIPDLTVSFGVRNFQTNNSNALLAGIELPLPLFNRNQGGVREAQSNLTRMHHQQRAAEIEIRADFTTAWQSFAAAYDEATALHNEILPGARSAFEAAEFGYREGKFGFLQLLDSQRTLFEIKRQSLQALASYHRARIEVDRLIGAPQHNLLQPATNRNLDKR